LPDILLPHFRLSTGLAATNTCISTCGTDISRIFKTINRQENNPRNWLLAKYKQERSHIKNPFEGRWWQR